MALPDWRNGNNYQGCLARALATEGFETIFPHGYRRGLPLARTNYAGASLLHIHWPEAYFASREDGFDWLRRLRFPLDLRLAIRRRPLVYTAHNFLPHGRESNPVLRRNYRAILTNAAGVIAHSGRAAQELAEFCPNAFSRIHVVPHGDAADCFPALPSSAEARRELGVRPAAALVLVFGRVEPYKGLEELIAVWSHLRTPAVLWIAGAPQSPDYARSLQLLSGTLPKVTLELRRLSDVELSLRIAAADVVLFNYRRIFTSGSACLARSLGKKILLPARLQTIDLMEPSSTVFRFETAEFDTALDRALAAPEDSAGTTAWRSATSWHSVALKTADIYRRILGERNEAMNCA